jgi:Fe-S-cluster containining protein
VAEPKEFSDDADTVPQCTGECCDPVTMHVEQYRSMSLNPKGWANARYILNMLTARGRVPSRGRAEFDCRYFDRETRRCTAYDRRPQMCRDFPEDGTCHFCGGTFPAKTVTTRAGARPSASERGRAKIVRALMGQPQGGAGTR